MFLNCSSNVIGPASSISKRCAVCGEYKTHSDFNANKLGKGGLSSRCKDCNSAYCRKWNADNQDKVKKRNTRYRAEHKKQIQEKDRAYYESHADERRSYARTYYSSNRDRLSETKRKQYASNPEPTIRRVRKYKEENADKVKESGRKSTAKNTIRNRDRAKKWREDNPEKSRETTREYYAKNAERIRERNRKYYAEHRDLAAIYSHRRRARKRGNGGTHTTEDLQIIRAGQTDKRGRLNCWWCGKPIEGAPHLDHKVPLARGGSNGPENLCYSCGPCNLSKSVKTPAEYAGRLI